MILSDEEIGKITEQCQGADWTYQLVRKTEAAVLDRLKAQEPVAYMSGHLRYALEKRGGYIPLAVEVSLVNMKWKDQIELYTYPIQADDVVRQRDELLAVLEHIRNVLPTEV